MVVVPVEFFESQICLLFSEKEVQEILDPEFTTLPTTLAQTFFDPSREQNVFALYINIPLIKSHELTTLERVIDHEVIHLVFYMMDFFNLPLKKGGDNEIFAYLHNYIDRLVMKELAAWL